MICAGKGWINIANYTLQCSKCLEYLVFDYKLFISENERNEIINEFLIKLNDTHKETCYWKTIDNLYMQFFPLDMTNVELKEDILMRIDHLNDIWDLPELKQSISYFSSFIKYDYIIDQKKDILNIIQSKYIII